MDRGRGGRGPVTHMKVTSGSLQSSNLISDQVCSPTMIGIYSLRKRGEEAGGRAREMLSCPET